MSFGASSRFTFWEYDLDTANQTFRTTEEVSAREQPVAVGLDRPFGGTASSHDKGPLMVDKDSS
ncbi:unnamed protein product [Timema podura]|uniref:Uncharacterized protein n=1 Tax=Timema podura TaxID=61482 RepID=A0ABN7P0K0_TIMPD|nr:unnamed protein product [Timema podura]